MRVKVCGIRHARDAALAVRLGADAIGLLVGQRHRSEDFLQPEQARAIADACPPLVTPVLVTHVEEAEPVIALARELRVTTIQMHSECSVAALRAVRRALPGVRLLRALHAADAQVLEQVRALADAVDAFIVDSANAAEDRVGGTGLTHDWALSRRIVEASPVPVILAGGLDGGNVARAIAAVRPYAVDANTRLRGADGFKDPAKVGAFVRAAKAGFFELAGGNGGEHGLGRP